MRQWQLKGQHAAAKRAFRLAAQAFAARPTDDNLNLLGDASRKLHEYETKISEAARAEVEEAMPIERDERDQPVYGVVQACKY